MQIINELNHEIKYFQQINSYSKKTFLYSKKPS